jgi:hypothetical protein
MPEEEQDITTLYSADFVALVNDLQTLYTAAQKDIEIFKELSKEMERGSEEAKAAGLNLAATSEAEAAAGDRMTEAFAAMEARLQTFMKWASQLEGVKVTTRDLAVQIQKELKVAGSPLGKLNFETILEGVKVQATETAAATKQAFDPAVLGPYQQRLQAITFQLEQMQALERELVAIGMKHDIEGLMALTTNPMYAQMLGGVEKYRMQPQTLFQPEVEGGLSAFDKLQAKVATYNRALEVVRAAQEAITGAVQATGQSWTNVSGRMTEILAQIKMVEDSIQTITAGTSQIVAKNDQEASSVAKVLEERQALLVTLREELAQLQARTSLTALTGQAKISPEQLASIPFHPSSFYKEPASMASALIRSLLEQQLKDPRLVNAMMSAIQPRAVETTAQAFGKKMHTLAQASLTQWAEQFELSLGDTLTTKVVGKGLKVPAEVSQEYSKTLNRALMSFEEPIKMIDKQGREWFGTMDVVDRQRKIIGDYKTYSEATLAELGAFSEGKKAWADLTTGTKGVVAQVTQYAQMMGKEWQAMVVRLPTRKEIGKGLAYPTETAAVSEANRQFLAGGGPLTYKIPIEKVNMEEARAIMEATRATAVGIPEFEELFALVQATLEIQKQRTTAQEQTNVAVSEEEKLRLAAEGAAARAGRAKIVPAMQQSEFDAAVASFKTLSTAMEERRALAGVGDVAALQAMNVQEQRGLATLERKIALSKQQVELKKAEGYGENLTAKQIADEIGEEEHNLANLKAQKREKEEINRLTKEAISSAKATAAAQVAARPAVAVPEADLTQYQARVASLIQQVETTSGEARRAALASLEQERAAYQRLIGQIQVSLAPLSKDAQLKAEAAASATAHAKALDLDAAAAEKQLLATLSSTGATRDQMGAQRVVADTKRNAAAAANVNAAALQQEADKAQQVVGAQRQQQQGLTQLRTVMSGVQKQYGENIKSADNWQSRLFSLHRIIQVFWGSLLAQIAYGTMGAIQQFISGSADLFVKFESNLARFQVAIRSTQRAVAEGFAGADINQTIGEFAGTVEQWTKDLDEFTKRWKVFTRQDALAGFKEFLNISRANNMGRELSLQLMDVAAALTLVEDEFANDLPRAMQAVARASDGYVRPMGATFIGMISDVDRNIKAMQIYGTVYSKLGEGNEQLKKQQQVLVDTAVILERYNRVAKDTSYLYETVDLKIRTANARIQEQQITIGSQLAPAWLGLKNVIVNVLDGLSMMIAALSVWNKLALRSSVTNPFAGAVIAGTSALGKYGPSPLATYWFAREVSEQAQLRKVLDKAAENNKDRRAMLQHWAEMQALIEGKTITQIIEALEKQGPEVILQAQATREQFQGLVSTGKNKEAIKLYDDLAAKLVEARTEYARLVAEGTNQADIVAANERLTILEAQVVALKQYSKTLSDADVVAQHLKDTMSEIDWTPEAAGIDIGDVADKLQDAWDEYLEKRQDAVDEKNKKLLESFDTFMDDLEEADIKHGDNLREIVKDTFRDMADAFRKAAHSRGDAYRDMLHSIAGENEDYALRLKELDQKQLDDKEKARRDHLQKLEDLEREHLRNLRDMQTQYEFDLTAAAEDRDARKVLELQRRHEFDIQQEGVHYGDRIADENRNFARQEEERKANDALERARLEREHKKRLEDIKLEYKHRLEEIKRALTEELKDIKEKEKQKVRDENERWVRDKVDAAVKYAERNRDIAKWLEDQYETIKGAYNKQVEGVLKSLNKQVDWTEDRMRKLHDAVKAALGPNGFITGVYDTWFAYIERRMKAVSVWQPPLPSVPTVPTAPSSPGVPEKPGEPAKPALCNDPKALNFGKPGPCVYRPRGTGPQEQLSATTPSAMLSAPAIATWTATSRLEIHVTADEHFSEGFEDALIDKITEVVRAV